MKMQDDRNLSSFKSTFVFGTATAAFQIEGAANEDGRVDSIWDRFCAEPNNIVNGDDGLVACDHYHLWEKDLQKLKDLGVDAYRFSMAWTRIITSTEKEISQTGLDFYQQIIDRLHFYQIKPFVTLYHWDLPQYLQEQGGWLNRDTAYQFAKYADVVSSHFGNQIHTYTTFNEPWCSAMLGYLHGIHAPGIKDRKQALQVAHIILLAHGLAMPLLRRNAPMAQHGIVLNMGPYDAASLSEQDQLAAELAESENNDWFIQPLLEGCYPALIQEIYPDELPDIESGDMDIISAPNDYLGINYYTRQVICHNPSNVTFTYDSVTPEEAEVTAMGWEVYPAGLTQLLVNLNKRYEMPPVYITENGMASDDDYDEVLVNDNQRVKYLREHLYAVADAIEAGVDVRGYFAWSLLDNFEWSEGYSKRFGLYYVDYVTQERVPKLSAHFYKDFIRRARSR